MRLNKKLLGIFFLALLAVTLIGCNGDTTTTVAPTTVEPTTKTPTTTELPTTKVTTTEAPSTTKAPVIEKKTTTGTMSWHMGTANFKAMVTVTVTDDYITEIEILGASEIMTGTFQKWLDGKESFIEQFIGLTTAEVADMQAFPPENINDHHDGGSVIGIDVVAGATASSTTVSMAIIKAVELIISGRK